MNKIILWKKLNSDAVIPEKSYKNDMGYDLRTIQDYTLTPNLTTKISTGIAMKLPDGFGAFIKDRSSVASKKGLFVVGGVIDGTYTGELIVVLHNGSNTETQIIHVGDKIAQVIIIPICSFQERVVEDFINNIDGRNNRGFGSSDSK